MQRPVDVQQVEAKQPNAESVPPPKISSSPPPPGKNLERDEKLTCSLPP